MNEAPPAPTAVVTVMQTFLALVVYTPSLREDLLAVAIQVSRCIFGKIYWHTIQRIVSP